MASAKPSMRSRKVGPPSRAPPSGNARSTYDAYRDEQDKTSGKKDVDPRSLVDPYKGQSLGEKVKADFSLLCPFPLGVALLVMHIGMCCV